MVTTVFAAPYQVPNAPNPWQGMTMLWTGFDGVVWDVTNGKNGLCMLPGLRGLTMPPITHYKSRTPALAGSRWRGSSTGEREVFWPIQVFHDAGSVAWCARDRAFWSTLQPQRTGVWTVVQPNGERRTLTLRFRDDGTNEYSYDPTLAGWSNYGITFDAEQPYWAGAAIKYIWSRDPDAPIPFFPGPPFVITSGTGIGAGGGAVVLNNPGDVSAYPVWTLKGPLTAAVLTVGGQSITVDFIVSSGEELVIDTSPSMLTAIMEGVDKVSLLTTSDFAAIPAGANVPLTISLVGAGTCQLDFTPLYYRSW